MISSDHFAADTIGDQNTELQHCWSNLKLLASVRTRKLSDSLDAQKVSTWMNNTSLALSSCTYELETNSLGILLSQFLSSAQSHIKFCSKKHGKINQLYVHVTVVQEYGEKKRGEKSIGRGGIRTHAIEMTGALNQRLRPLGHPTS